MTASRFEPANFVAEIEQVARAGGWIMRYISPTPSSTRPWLQNSERPALNRLGQPAPRFYLSAGIHGDEIAGPLAVLEMLRMPGFFDAVDATIFPLLNPEGLARAVRENYYGVDLNRDYRLTKSAEIRGHLKVLPGLGTFDAAMTLHEDYEATAAYLFELNDGPDPDLGRRIIAAMGRHVPIDDRFIIDDLPAKNGIIIRSEIVRVRGPIQSRPDWPEAIYLSLNHTKVSYTPETPMLQPLEQRVAAQVEAVRTVLEALVGQA